MVSGLLQAPGQVLEHNRGQEDPNKLIVAPDEVSDDLQTSIVLRAQVGESYQVVDVEGEEDGHVFFLLSLRYCRKLLRSSQQTATKLIQKQEQKDAKPSDADNTKHESLVVRFAILALDDNEECIEIEDERLQTTNLEELV